MLRIILTSMIVGLWGATSASAASWAEDLFDNLHHDFGSVPRGPTVEHLFHLTNKTGQPLHIADVRVSCGCTKAIALQQDLAKGESTAIEARMDTSRFAGIRQVTIFVQFDRPQWEEVRLTVQANSREDVTFSQESLDLGRIKRGNGGEAGIDISFAGNNGWQILEAKADSNYVQPHFQEVRRNAAEAAYRVTARVRPDTPIGSWTTNVWLTTNNPNLPQLRVPLNVEVESALSISPAVAALGQVKAGLETKHKVIVRGDSPFRIIQVQGTDSQMSVQDASPESKALHVLTLTLKPQHPGDLNRSLRIITDLKDNSEIDLPTTAQVVP